MSDDSDFSAEQIERGRLLFARQTRFLLGVADLGQLPEAFATEMAFAGRSNVGKSSLLNALTGRRDIARTSNTPGRTRELNFFTLDGTGLALVDVPGYGYARAQKTLVRKWQALLRAYLRGRASLARVFVLVDARHGLKSADLTMLDDLDATAVAYQIVLTKTDKLKPAERLSVSEATARAIAKRPAAHPRLHVTSSLKTWGIAELRAEIASLAADTGGL